MKPTEYTIFWKRSGSQKIYANGFIHAVILAMAGRILNGLHTDILFIEDEYGNKRENIKIEMS